MKEEVDSYFCKGNSYFDKKDHKNALVCFEKVVEIDPKIVNAWLNMGVICFEIGDYLQSEICYKRILDINPNNADAYCNIGSIYGIQKNYEQALAFYKKAIEIDPEQIDAFYSLGSVCFFQGQNDRAISCYQKVLSLDPEHINANYALGNIYHVLENDTIAFEYLKKAAKLGFAPAQELLKSNGQTWNYMNDNTNIINPQIAKYGNVSAYYNFWNVEDDIAKDIAEIIFTSFIFCPKDIYYNFSYPELDFELTKYNDKRGRANAS
jgi:superkiller protein 3